MIRAESPGHGECRGTRAAADVEHLMLRPGDSRFDEPLLERLEQLVEHLLQGYPRVTGGAIPEPGLFVSGVGAGVHHRLLQLAFRVCLGSLWHFKST